MCPAPQHRIDVEATKDVGHQGMLAHWELSYLSIDYMDRRRHVVDAGIVTHDVVPHGIVHLLLASRQHSSISHDILQLRYACLHAAWSTSSIPP